MTTKSEVTVQYRHIPSCGLTVSEIAFGCGGTAGLMVRGTFEEQVAAAERAIELGVNYFDESPDYGYPHGSEENLGKVLKHLGVRPIITTKVEVRPGDMDDIAGHVERSVEESLRRLGTDWVDIVQIHNGPVAKKPELGEREYRVLWIEDYFGKNGAMEGLDRIVAAGKTRYVGFICRGDDGRQVRQLLDTGRFHMINLIHHLLNPSAGTDVPGLKVDADFGQVIDAASENGVGVAVYSPLAGGSLTDQAVAGLDPHRLSGSRRSGAAVDRARHQASALKFLATEDRTLQQAAYRFILDYPGVTTVLGGFSDVQQVEELCAVPDMEGLTDVELARIDMVWRANFGL